MKTNIDNERMIRGLDNDASIDDIAYGSLIPMLFCDDNPNIDEVKTIEVLFCESISGGADYFKDMPKRLSLNKLKKEDSFETTGELESFIAEYIQVDSIEYPKSINDINIYGVNGKLLIAALSMLTTQVYTEATPDQVLKKLIELSKKIYDE
jgi:hypothetical protein